MLWNGPAASQCQASHNVALSLDLDLVGVEFSALPYEYETALTKVPADHRRVLVVANSRPLFRDRCSLAKVALNARAASMFAWREWWTPVA
jgi:hypothetical protein